MKNKEKRVDCEAKDNKCNICDIIQKFNILEKDKERIEDFN